MGDGDTTLTVATGGVVTETLAVPDLPALVAVMVTGPPWVTPWTTPEPETEATASFDELQVKLTPAMMLPLASLAVAVNGSVSPTSSVVLGGETVTVATEGGGGGGGGVVGVPPLLQDIKRREAVAAIPSNVCVRTADMARLRENVDTR